MEFRHVQAFLAITDELHFGRAAEKLHLTQPSLSQRLQRLERELGVELVARTTHEVRLARAGQAFQAEASAIVTQLERTQRLAREAAAGRSGVVRVGYDFAAGQHVLPAVVERMHADYPNVTVVLQEGRTGPQFAALADGALDFALVYGRPVASALQWRSLLRLSMVAMVGHRHKWAGRPGVPFPELAGQPCVLFRRELSPAMYDAIVHSAGEAGIRLDVAYELEDLAATEILVSARPLVGFVSLSRASFAGARTRPVQLYDPVPAVELCVAWRDNPDNQLQKAFLDCLDAVGPFATPPRPMHRRGRAMQANRMAGDDRPGAEHADARPLIGSVNRVISTDLTPLTGIAAVSKNCGVPGHEEWSRNWHDEVPGALV